MASFQAASADRPTTEAAVPKKRRRRAPATGATEDCFTCRKRQVECDRKRPYCTQCVDLGRECSGYKTVLTWGVGVASRGKLRGLSLPIVNSSPKPSGVAKRSSTSSETKASECVASGSNASNTRLAASGTKIKAEDATPTTLATSSTGTSMPYAYIGISVASPTAIQYSTTPPLGWSASASNNHADGYSTTIGRRPRGSSHPRPLQKIYTFQAPSNDESVLSASTAPWSAYSDTIFPSPVGFTHSSDGVSFTDPFADSLSTPSLCHQNSTGSIEDVTYTDIQHSYLTTADGVSSSFAPARCNNVLTQAISTHNGSSNCANATEVFYGGPDLPALNTTEHYGHIYGLLASHLRMDAVTHEENTPTDPTTSFEDTAISRSISPFGSYQLPSRMHFLLDYYSNAICPVLVAFDGPTNPYRMHILRLAMDSEGLQSAIAALATNNMRMRGYLEKRRHKNDSSYRNTPPFAPPTQLCTSNSPSIHGDPTPEEARYKTASVQILNSALRNPACANDDSVLAMLLILCLFHVCDSGFTKFKTQLAGVQKLLSMRDGNVQSSFAGWIEMFFIWFDVMTSTVNDREIQIRGDSLDMLDLSANLGALEHLAGCDGRLFKLIARLGRLNLLSQNRPVREAGAQPARRPSPKFMTAKEYYSLQYDRLDGNGWHTPPISPPEETGTDSEDLRHEFWTEWHTIRELLQKWRTETPPSPPSSSALPAQTNLSTPLTQYSATCDLQHISESFRYSALLYTERLAHPSLPPGMPNFQSLVARALFHISCIAVTSCVNKFLLWPLFIAGTECTDEAHRDVVRRRCVEIQRESGFFNNLSGLEVLERVWREDDGGVGEGMGTQVRQGCGRQAFRWRRAMDKVDGEYIVI